ncbi:MAG: aminotransferase class III-fold pyridoxal phosphate-dependent enzyme [Hyphomicrobiales bacterium]|nr:aminotransferase class III-fold pyridoxal phosphate-dependent enzyme [Hyphomicrobiales bacterium]
MTQPPAQRYARSQQMLARALKVIPLGSQTFSKAHTQYPAGHAPLFLTRGRGGRVWDVDGNEYVDLVCGLLPVVLGYGDPDVDAAVRAQLEAGVSFSLATELEVELAERLVEIIPCAEMVRFGKNGTDATSAIVRIARAHTGRDRVIACGYHGWQDWYIGATVRNKGVPRAVGELTHKLPYNDLAAVEAVLTAHPGEVALVILEPMGVEEPAPDYLPALRDLAHRHGALFAFDEVITGFRFALGGAQEYFGVTPDLASFGKAMGNGLPISAVVGRADLMAEMEEIFFSATFGGEALSLAASIAVIDKMRRQPVIETLWATGRRIRDGVAAAAARHGLADAITVKGKDPWTVLAVTDSHQTPAAAIKTFVMRELLAEGVLSPNCHNVCYAHSRADVDQVLAAYDRVLARTAGELAAGTLEANLGCPPVMPVFRVRESS